MCPVISGEHFSPPGVPALSLTMEQRDQAALNHFEALAGEGRGRIIPMADGRQFFVPSEPEALATDLAAVLGSPVLGAIFGAVFDSLEDRIVRRLIDTPPVTDLAAPDVEIAPVAPPVQADILVDALLRMERTNAKLVGILEALHTSLGQPAPTPQPAPDEEPLPVGNASETIIEALADEGFTLSDGIPQSRNADGVPYIGLHNGVRVGDKEPVVPVATPQKAIAATIAGIKALAGERRLIQWRQRPELQLRDTGWVVRCRLVVI